MCSCQFSIFYGNFFQSLVKRLIAYYNNTSKLKTRSLKIGWHLKKNRLQREPGSFALSLAEPFTFTDPLGDKILNKETGKWELDSIEKAKIASLQALIGQMQAAHTQVEELYKDYLVPQICPPGQIDPVWSYYNCEALSKLKQIEQAIAATQSYIQAIESWNPGWLKSRTPQAYMSGYTFDFRAYEGQLSYGETLWRAFTSGLKVGFVAGLYESGANISGSRLEIIVSARKKIFEKLTTKFETSIFGIIGRARKYGKSYLDTRSGNINIYIPRSDKSGFIRITLDPSKRRIISAGLNKAKDVRNLIEKARVVPLE